MTPAEYGGISATSNKKVFKKKPQMIWQNHVSKDYCCLRINDFEIKKIIAISSLEQCSVQIHPTQKALWFESSAMAQEVCSTTKADFQLKSKTRVLLCSSDKEALKWKRERTNDGRLGDDGGIGKISRDERKFIIFWFQNCDD